MSEVIIAGIGQTAAGEQWDTSLRRLALQAIEGAMDDAGGLKPQALFVGNMLAPQISHQAHLGALIADYAGLTGIEACTTESAGASGGAALRAGYLAVASEMVDVALVVGVEKFTDSIGAGIESALTSSTDSDYEGEQGISPISLAAILMQRYLFEYQIEHDAFAGFAVNAHANGAANPKAMFQKAISVEAYRRADLVSDPLNVFDAAPNCDGAAALILTRPGLLPPNYPHRFVRVAGSHISTDTLALHDRPQLLVFEAARRSIERACQKARIHPLQADFFELHDAYSIYSALSLEAAGFAEAGRGWKLAQRNAAEPEISLSGSMPISTMGGLKARGNPGGASGVYQAVEATLQLRGQAGANQLPNPRRALIQCLGGPASAAATHVLEVLD